MKNLTKEIILDFLEKNKQKIKSFGVKKLILFGSFAKDEQNENSDIDFLVEFESNRGLYEDYIGLLHFLEDSFNKKIDLVKPNLLREELKPYILNSTKYEKRI
jgi:hypothetical protein